MIVAQTYYSAHVPSVTTDAADRRGQPAPDRRYAHVAADHQSKGISGRPHETSQCAAYAYDRSAPCAHDDCILTPRVRPAVASKTFLLRTSASALPQREESVLSGCS